MNLDEKPDVYHAVVEVTKALERNTRNVCSKANSIITKIFDGLCEAGVHIRISYERKGDVKEIEHAMQELDLVEHRLVFMVHSKFITPGQLGQVTTSLASAREQLKKWQSKVIRSSKKTPPLRVVDKDVQ